MVGGGASLTLGQENALVGPRRRKAGRWTLQEDVTLYIAPTNTNVNSSSVGYVALAFASLILTVGSMAVRKVQKKHQEELEKEEIFRYCLEHGLSILQASRGPTDSVDTPAPTACHPEVGEREAEGGNDIHKAHTGADTWASHHQEGRRSVSPPLPQSDVMEAARYLEEAVRFCPENDDIGTVRALVKAQQLPKEVEEVITTRIQKSIRKYRHPHVIRNRLA